MTTTWLYIIVLWAGFSQPRPIPYQSPKACEQAKASIVAAQGSFRTGAFMSGFIVKCSPEHP